MYKKAENLLDSDTRRGISARKKTKHSQTAPLSSETFYLHFMFYQYQEVTND